MSASVDKHGNVVSCSRAGRCNLLKQARTHTGVVVTTQQVRGIRDTLQDLLDNQNGCPLPKYQQDFDRSSAAARQLIDELFVLIKEE